MRPTAGRFALNSDPSCSPRGRHLATRGLFLRPALSPLHQPPVPCPNCTTFKPRDFRPNKSSRSTAIATGFERLPAAVARKKRGKTDKMLQKGKLYRGEGNREGDRAEMLWVRRRLRGRSRGVKKTRQAEARKDTPEGDSRSEGGIQPGIDGVFQPAPTQQRNLG
jgi:hypothetical protein